MSNFRKWSGLTLLILWMLIIVLSSASSASVTSNTATQSVNTPVDHNGQKWRIGYAETDPYGNFAGTLYGIVKGLEKLGWLTGVEEIPYQHGQADSRVMWQWLAAADIGPYIQFVADAHYSFIDNEQLVKDQINERLTKQSDRDIDLMLVMGTLAGNHVATELHHVPTLVFSSSNPVDSGIIQSVEDSGYDHIWAHMDPERYKKQVQLFYDIFQYKKLGMLYENSDVGRIYAAVEDVAQFAVEHEVEIEARYVNEPRSQAEYERYYADLAIGFKELAEQVDAMYLTFGVWELDRLPELLQPFYDKRIPVFSQLGPEEVQQGALLSLARPNFDGIGLFGADTIAQVLKGAKPRELPQVYGDTPSIVINMEVADRIGYRVPFEILLTADGVMTQIGDAK